ncbi:TMEM175 family protein [Streptomyces sp. NPDC005423]|uniref:TMEM175 family protein n=1 Tax=Streptomyces sp. NPDC005423 TaxID=3155343 RepID=UPI0033A57D6F
MTEHSVQTRPREDGTGMARLVALSDGIYAIAMTLLVIDVSIPGHLDSAAFHRALREALPSLGAFALSFTLIAGFWRDQRRILTGLTTASTLVTRVTLLGLGLVAMLPFPTALLAEYASQPDAVAFYAGVTAAIHAVHVVMLLLTQGQVEPSRAADRRRFTARLTADVLVFLLSVPLAFLDTTAAMWFWLALLPVQYLLRLSRPRP